MRLTQVITILATLCAVPGIPTGGPAGAGEKVFRAGASAVDVTPERLPVIISGSFLERTAGAVRDPLHARCLVLDDGTTRLAVVVVDSLMMPRDLLDEAKQAAEQATGIPAACMMVAATHTHSAPSVAGALGSGVDQPYARWLPGRIARAVDLAAANLKPAKVGWTVVKADRHTHCRRWIRRPDRIGADPFGQWTVRAMMHPGYQNPDYVGPAGPADPALSILAVQSAGGQPIAVLANYSMHYFGATPVSADYCGRFAEQFGRLAAPAKADPPFVAIMSQGTSGDLHWMDYGRPRKSIGIDAYSQQLAELAYEAYKKIGYSDWVPLGMREAKLALKRRVPDERRLAWAREIVATIEGRKPKNHPEIYALEQFYLHEDPVRELKLQALRIGPLGITAMPCEVFGITGLKIKVQSPLQPTFNLELANGAEGYIPPPEQHKLGGYTTWPARSAGLEVRAEPQIVETVLTLLEELAAAPRRKAADPRGPYARAVLRSDPAAYWQLGEHSGRRASDLGPHGNHGTYEDGVAFYLEGPQAPGFCDGKAINRAAHFAGGRMKAAVRDLGTTYSVEMCLLNGLPADARPVTGYFFSRGLPGAENAAGDHLGIGGTHLAAETGRLIFFNGNDPDQVLCGRTEIPLRTWNHVVLVRDGRQVTVYLNGNPAPEISGEAEITYSPGAGELLVGGRSDNFANFEGKIDEVAVYRRALTREEVAAHYQASGLPARAE